MRSNVLLPLLAAACLAVAACAPQREPDLSTIRTNYETVEEGDVGALLHHLYQAAQKAEYAEQVRARISSEPGYLFTDGQLRQRAVQASLEAVEHRNEAEAALARILDPLRARIAYLESLHLPQGTGPFEQSVLFDTGSAAIPQAETGKIEAVARFVAAYPLSAVIVTGFADSVGDKHANQDLSRRRAAAVVEALRGFGLPPATTLAVSSEGEAPGPDDTPDIDNRTVLIRVEAHGAPAR